MQLESAPGLAAHRFHGTSSHGICLRVGTVLLLNVPTFNERWSPLVGGQQFICYESQSWPNAKEEPGEETLFLRKHWLRCHGHFWERMLCLPCHSEVTIAPSASNLAYTPLQRNAVAICAARSASEGPVLDLLGSGSWRRVSFQVFCGPRSLRPHYLVTIDRIPARSSFLGVQIA